MAPSIPLERANGAIGTPETRRKPRQLPAGKEKPQVKPKREQGSH
jgi:hypothetical protein